MDEKDNDSALMCFVYVLKYMYALLKSRKRGTSLVVQ